MAMASTPSISPHHCQCHSPVPVFALTGRLSRSSQQLLDRLHTLWATLQSRRLRSLATYFSVLTEALISRSSQKFVDPRTFELDRAAMGLIDMNGVETCSNPSGADVPCSFRSGCLDYELIASLRSLHYCGGPAPGLLKSDPTSAQDHHRPTACLGGAVSSQDAPNPCEHTSFCLVYFGNRDCNWYFALETMHFFPSALYGLSDIMHSFASIRGS
jgi:hypothetical protein